MNLDKKFNEHSTAEEVAEGVDLRGKNAIVTGGYSGIGLETARVLAIKGAHVFIIGRDIKKCNEEVEKLKILTGSAPMEMDLASQASIRQFVEEFNRLNIPLHFLFNNAGVMACPQGITKDGIETQFGVNHVGHFMLTTALLPKLIEGAPSRVVIVSSAALFISGIRWNDINFEKSCSYGDWTAYGQSKSANALFSIELNRRYKDQGVTSNALHPGVINTNLQRHGVFSWNLIKNLPKMVSAGRKGFGSGSSRKSIPEGAATSIYASLSPLSGRFFADCHEAELPDHASDPEDAQRLWDVTEKMIIH